VHLYRRLKAAGYEAEHVIVSGRRGEPDWQIRRQLAFEASLVPQTWPLLSEWSLLVSRNLRVPGRGPAGAAIRIAGVRARWPSSRLMRIRCLAIAGFLPSGEGHQPLRLVNIWSTFSRTTAVSYGQSRTTEMCL
jgi:hypothetical protein